ncbi:MAG: LacI family DNA-binding transcriptional regulator [Sphingomonas sp.]|jgi:LacI family transcriptional regulator
MSEKQRTGKIGEATIRDVARVAQVSVASVSRALNGLSNVRGETRDRIMAAVATLGYVPHAGARSLSLSRAHSIGVVLPDLHGEFFSECVRGMDREASRRGYVLLLSNMHGDGEKAALALRAMHGRVDGLIVMAPHISAASLDRALPASLPVVLINSPSAGRNQARMCFDNAAGVDAVIRHLVDSGHREIVHIAGPEDNLDAHERKQAYIDAMHRHAPGVEPRIVPGDFTEAAGEHAAEVIMADPRRTDALFAANDGMALGALQILRRAGKQVPGDIALAGFDDVPMARYLDLTTVRVRIAELGARAVERLIDRLEGKSHDLNMERQMPELVARATSGPARHDHD